MSYHSTLVMIKEINISIGKVVGETTIHSHCCSKSISQYTHNNLVTLIITLNEQSCWNSCFTLGRHPIIINWTNY